MLQATCEWIYVYPQGIYDLMVYVKRKYKNPTIYITENGKRLIPYVSLFVF